MPYSIGILIKYSNPLLSKLKNNNLTEFPFKEAPEISIGDLEIELDKLMAKESQSSNSNDNDNVLSSFDNSNTNDNQPNHDNQPSPNIQRTTSIKLDILHAMQRLENGCSTTKDPLFGLFMRKIKEAIFMKNSDDLDLLKKWLIEHRKMSEVDFKKLPSYLQLL